MAEGLFKGIGVCIDYAAASEWPVDLSLPAEGITLAKLRVQGLRGRLVGGRM